MSFELRRLTADDAPGVRHLESLAFSAGRPSTPPADADAASETKFIGDRWGIFEGGKIRSTLEVCPFQSHWGDETVLPMGGIAGVATSPEARGRGHVEALLRHSLVEMRAAGQVVSALYPFSWSFYRKHGWDWVGEEREVTIPLTELKKADEGREVVMLETEGHRETLAPAYTAYARQFRGAFTAKSHKWDAFKPSDSRQTYIYQYPPTGEYMAWQYTGEDRRGRIREWVVWTPEGHRALLSLLHYLANQCPTASVSLPANALLPQFLMHWSLKVKSTPVFAARVVDVAAALNALPTMPGIANAALRLTLHDAQAPWNDGIHAIVVEGGKVHCTSIEGAGNGDASISMDIQMFSQAFWGHPSLDRVRAAGRVEVRDEVGYALLRAILPESTVFTMDDF